MDKKPIITPQALKNSIGLGLGLGVVASIGLLIFVFMTEQTFGQRCAKFHDDYTIEWYDCINALREGKEIP